MKTYCVEIKETLSAKRLVKANSLDKAKNIVANQYNNSLIELNYENYDGAIITGKIATENDLKNIREIYILDYTELCPYCMSETDYSDADVDADNYIICSCCERKILACDKCIFDNGYCRGCENQYKYMKDLGI